MKKNWIDFKALRSKLDFAQVLEFYGVKVKRKGDQHMGYCPLPNHNGKRNSPSFSANLTKGIFQCFGCGAKGNTLDFGVLMEHPESSDGSQLHEVALKLQQHFCPEMGKQPADEPPTSPKKAEPASEKPIVVNQPLDFELKGLDAEHPYLASRGFTLETIRYFGLGYCSRGLLRGRIAIPLHGPDGKLLGYAGRVVDDSTIHEENPRYRFPGKREKDGVVYEFRKTSFLYNGFRIKAPVDSLVVVEGFTSVWWLHQNGLPNPVGTMGADCSDAQAALIVSSVKPDGRVWLLPDGDEAGERLAESLLMKISPHRFVRWVKLAEAKQPTDMSSAVLKSLKG